MKRKVSGTILALLVSGMLTFDICLTEEHSLLILVVVESSLLDSIEDGLFQYCEGLDNEGYVAQIIEYNGGAASQLRDNISSYDPDGVFFVGDLPVAWFEINSTLVWPEYQNFPFDYYYMDLDGVWLDNNDNGYFDEHTGNIGPEVFFGRLKASDMSLIGDETSIIKDYLSRTHAYRTGSMNTQNKSLIYWCSNYDCNARDSLPEIYEKVDIVDHPNGGEEDVKQKLQEGYQFVLLGGMGHSNSQFISMEKIGGEKLYNSEVVALNPQSQFYVIHSCLNSRYVDSNFVAGSFAYTGKGLITIGTSKGGGGIGRGEIVYESLGSGQSFGNAIKNLFENLPPITVDPWRYEYYSTVLVGDPTLKIMPSERSCSIIDVETSKTVLGQGHSLSINVTVQNQGNTSNTFNLTVYANENTIDTKELVLENGSSTVTPFTWNTTDFPKGNYTISAWLVLGEMDDNLFTDGWVIVAMIGDITGPQEWPDGKCDMRDIGLVARHFGKTVPPGPPNCDITGQTSGVPDGKIDMRDIGTVARHFGETDP